MTLGDGEVVEEAACGQCQLVPDSGRRRRHGRLPWRRSSREAPTAQPPPPPHDGPLVDGARYTAFVQLVGRWLAGRPKRGAAGGQGVTRLGWGLERQ